MGNINHAVDSLRLKYPWLEHITHDLYGIAERLRGIDRSYFVMYNRRSNHYEVHTSEADRATLCFVVPYDQLDARTLDYAKETRIENTNKIIAKIEADNKKLEESRMRDFRNAMESASYETADSLQLAQEKDGLHDSYKRTFSGVSV